jgi:diguanylate cyclase (GGDEF)-like protein/PAS domain S-box-containing protein
LADAIRLLDFGSDALLCLDEGRRVVLCNRGAEQLFGLDSRAMEGINWQLLLAQGSRDLLGDALRRLDKFDHPSNISLRDGALFGLRWDGKEFPMEGSLSRLQLGSSRGYTLLLRDVSARVEYETRLRYLAVHDSLTRLPNRALLMDRLESAIRRHRRSRKKFALLFIDLDGFKEINDRFGHAVGDAVLRDCATRLRRAMRDSDTAARIGGDEFVVILEEVDGLDDVQQARERIERSLGDEPIALEQVTLQMRASMGFTLYPEGGTEPEELLARADEAMYDVKHRRDRQQR